MQLVCAVLHSAEYVSISPVARSVFLFYLLTRLQAQDVQQSQALLMLLPSLKTSSGESVWSGPASTGEQHLLHGVLQTIATLLIGLKDTLKTDSALRVALFPGCFLQLARQNAFAHQQCMRLMIAFVDSIPADDISSYLSQLEEGGRRAEAATTDDAAAAGAGASPLAVLSPFAFDAGHTNQRTLRTISRLASSILPSGGVSATRLFMGLLVHFHCSLLALFRHSRLHLNFF